MRLLVGGLIHEREQVIPYLKHLSKLDVTGLDIHWCFVLDNVSNDFLARLPWWGKDVQLHTPLIPGPQWSRHEADKPQCFARLAQFRNILREQALLDGYDAMITIDSDIIAPPHLLTALTRTAVFHPWVSALVRNRPPDHDDGRTFNVIKFDVTHNRIQHFRPWGVDVYGRLWPASTGSGCDIREKPPHLPLIIGAACLYRRDVLEHAEFGMDRRGEDIYFGIQAIRAGYSGWYLPIECEHLMTEKQLQFHTAGCALCQT